MIIARTVDVNKYVADTGLPSSVGSWQALDAGVCTESKRRGGDYRQPDPWWGWCWGHASKARAMIITRMAVMKQ